MTWRRFVGVLLLAAVFVGQHSSAIAVGQVGDTETSAQARHLILQEVLAANSSPTAEAELQRAVQDADYTPEVDCTFLLRSSSFDANQLRELVEEPLFSDCQSETSTVNMATTKVLVRDGQPVAEHIIVVVLR